MTAVLFFLKVLVLIWLVLGTAFAIVGLVLVAIELKLIFSKKEAQVEDEIRRTDYVLKCLHTEMNIAKANKKAIDELYWWYDNGILSTHEMYVLVNRLEISQWFN